MKKNLERTIEIPQGFQVEVKGNKIAMKGKEKELKREFNLGKVKLVSNEGKIKISAKNATRRESKTIGTTWAHIKNMIKGLNEDFVYELEICNVHFPMNVKVEESKVIIKSFLGEKMQRESKILPNVKVDIKGNHIIVSSHDKEAAGQTAANLEKATKLQGRDRRIFQDGIYITNKWGKKI